MINDETFYVVESRLDFCFKRQHCDVNGWGTVGNFKTLPDIIFTPTNNNGGKLVKSRHSRKTSCKIPRRTAPLVSSLGTISRELWRFIECGSDDILLF